MSIEESNAAEDAPGKVALIEADNDAGTVDMAQAEQVLFYGEASISGPDWLKDAAQSKANFAQRLPGVSEWTIGNGVGSLGQLTREEAAEKEREETAEWFEQWSEGVEQAQREEREREEWSQARHNYAGMDMTGEEWGEFADQLKGDTPLRKWLLEKLKKEGKSDAKANETVDQMALLSKMQSLPPSQWTDEMKALDTKLDANPALRQDLDKRLREAKKAESSLKLDKTDASQTAGIEKAGTEASAMSGSDLLAEASGKPVALTPSKSTTFASSLDEPAFASAPDLGQHHRAALEATTPLDAPKQVAAIVPPSATVTPSPGGGFDV